MRSAFAIVAVSAAALIAVAACTTPQRPSSHETISGGSTGPVESTSAGAVSTSPSEKTESPSPARHATAAPATPTRGTAGPSGQQPSASAARTPAPAPLPATGITHDSATPTARTYRWHRNIVATTFWVREIFDPNAADGSQQISTYDSHWMAHYGGCDGVRTKRGACETQRRTAKNGYFPTAMRPKQNPFYLDLPFDDVNDSVAFAERSRVIPWAHDPAYRKIAKNPAYSLMKNRWVELTRNGRRCYGQIEDAGPGQYHDAAYVFGTAAPANKRYGGAGMDVSPALNGCLGFTELNGDTDRVSWRFIERAHVPRGPWTRLVTRSGLDET